MIAKLKMTVCCKQKCSIYICKVEPEGKNYFYIGSMENYIKHELPTMNAHLETEINDFIPV